MVDIFKKGMCNYCKNKKCNKKIIKDINKGVVIYKCEEYIKDNSKIEPYVEPLLVTAKRSYVQEREI